MSAYLCACVYEFNVCVHVCFCVFVKLFFCCVYMCACVCVYV